MLSLKESFKKSADAEARKRDDRVNKDLSKLAGKLEKKIRRHIRWHPGNPELSFEVKGLNECDFKKLPGFKQLDAVCKKNDIMLDFALFHVGKGGYLPPRVDITLDKPYSASFDLSWIPKNLPKPSFDKGP